MPSTKWSRAVAVTTFAIASLAARESLADGGSTRAPSSPLDEFFGSFQESVAIDVPAFHGLEPKLALTYDSSAGNGFVGVGWRLTGFPTIERASPGGGAPNWAPLTPQPPGCYPVGFVGPLPVGAQYCSSGGNDIFLLDGVELVRCASGSPSPSCMTGGTHSTKIENYERITFDQNANVWYVWQRNGTKLTFTSTLGSFCSSPGACIPGTFRWGLASVVDTRGNQVSYSWSCDQIQTPPGCYPVGFVGPLPYGAQYCSSTAAGECYPAAVDYDGVHVGLNRAARPDPYSTAAGGALSETEQRLKWIDVQVSGNRARAYDLEYAYSGSTQRSLLSSVQQIGRDASFDAYGDLTGGTALPPKTFGYTAANTSAGFGTWWGNGNWGWNFGASSPHRTLTGDFNGDGKKDFLLAGSDGTTWVWLSTGGSFVQQLWSDVPSWGPIYQQGSAAHTFVGDFNGDGKDDFLFTWNNGNWDVGISDGTKFNWQQWYSNPGWSTVIDAHSQARTSIGDFNGDGKKDFMFTWTDGSIWVGLSTGSSFNFGSWRVAGSPWGPASPWAGDRDFVGDFNGDGKDDFLFTWNDGNWWVGESTGSTFDFRAWYGNGGWGGVIDPNSQARTRLGDFNGDGKEDFVFTWTDGSIWVGLSTGSSFVFNSWRPAGQPWGPASTANVDRDFVGDFNGDGKDDFLFTWNDGNWWLGQSNGATFEFVPWYSNGGWGGVITSSSPARTYVGDFTGDGRTDFMFTWTDGTLWVGAAGGGVGDLLSTCANGIGGTTSVAYLPSSQWANTNNPPLRQTVTSVTTNDGRGGVSTTGYSYQGGLFDPMERRFMGFHYVASRLPAIGGESMGPYRETWFHQDYGSVSKPQQINYSSGSGILLTATFFEYASNGATLPYTSLESGHWEWLYDGSGGTACPGANCKRTYLTHAYDAWGNDVVDTYWGDYDAPNDERTVQSFYVPNTGAFVTGLTAAVNTWAGPSTGGTLLQQTLRYYDNAGTWNQAPSVGNGTATYEWLDAVGGYVASYASFDGAGNMVGETDATGATTSHQFDTTYHRLPIATTDALHHTSSVQWDPVCDAVVSATDANGQVTSTQYDALCRPTFSSGPLGAWVQTRYANVGNPSNTNWTTPNGQYIEVDTPSADGQSNQWSRRYLDGYGRTYFTQSKGPAPGRDIFTAVAFDARGNTTATYAPWYGGDPAGPATVVAFDALNRPLRTTFADNASTTNSYSLWTTTSVDAMGHAKTSSADAYGHVVQRTEYVGGQPVVTLYRFDLRGNPVGVTDAAGNTWSYVVDSLGRKLSSQDPDTGAWSYAYDAAGRETAHTDALGQTTTFAYDALGRRTSKTSRAGTPQAVTVTWRYDEQVGSVGRLTTVTDPSGFSVMSYDALGRLVSSTEIADGVAFIFTNAYDAAGRVIAATYPDGETVRTTYDGAGRVATIPGYVNSAQYDASGQLVMQVNANGTTTTRSYSPQRLWLTGITTTSSSGTQQQTAFGRDAEGKIAWTSSPLAHETWSYGYDDLNRLVSASSATDGTQTFSYDLVGNMQSNSLYGAYTYSSANPQPAGCYPPDFMGPLPSGAVRCHYSHPHALQTVAGSTYAYDANGNLVSGGGRSFTWDGDDRLATVNGVAFYYDANGNRIKKVDGGVTTYYVGADVEYTGGTFKKYLSLAGILVAQTDGGTRYWLHTDDKGSVQSVTDANGREVEHVDYRPFGDRLASTGAYPERHGFLGQELDETGLVYLKARYYDPMLGRFLSPDPTPPSASSNGLNRYAYASNDPIDRVDPDGADDYGADYGGFVDGWQPVASFTGYVGMYGGGTIGDNFGSGFSGGFMLHGVFGSATGDLAFETPAQMEAQVEEQIQQQQMNGLEASIVPPEEVTAVVATEGENLGATTRRAVAPAQGEETPAPPAPAPPAPPPEAAPAPVEAAPEPAATDSAPSLNQTGVYAAAEYATQSAILAAGDLWFGRNFVGSPVSLGVGFGRALGPDALYIANAKAAGLAYYTARNYTLFDNLASFFYMSARGAEFTNVTPGISVVGTATEKEGWMIAAGRVLGPAAGAVGRGTNVFFLLDAMATDSTSAARRHSEVVNGVLIEP